MNIAQAAKEADIYYPTAKAIAKIFRREGRTNKKIHRERNAKHKKVLWFGRETNKAASCKGATGGGNRKDIEDAAEPLGKDVKTSFRSELGEYRQSVSSGGMQGNFNLSGSRGSDGAPNSKSSSPGAD